MIRIEFTIFNPDNPESQYIITPNDESSFWITKGDGEGAEFESKKLFKVIDKFYKDNF